MVRTATFLFAAGQETTARLLATSLKYLAESPPLQDELRADARRIPDFVEELRTLGLTQADLDPLWHGAEAYIREWEASTAWAGNFNQEDNKGIQEQCSALRDHLINDVASADRLKALDSLLATGCHGAPSS